MWKELVKGTNVIAVTLDFLIPAAVLAQDKGIRKASCRNKQPMMVYQDEVSEWIIGSTPLKKEVIGVLHSPRKQMRLLAQPQ